MNRTKILIKAIESERIDTICYVPCSTLSEIIDYFSHKKNFTIFPLNREEEGIGIIAGLYLSGKKPLLMIQDSGLGNSYNAIITLLQLYRIPVPIIVARRGSIGEMSPANAMWADNTSAVNKVLGIQEFLLGAVLPIEFWENAIKGAFQHSRLVNLPVVIQINLRNKGEYKGEYND